MLRDAHYARCTNYGVYCTRYVTHRSINYPRYAVTLYPICLTLYTPRYAIQYTKCNTRYRLPHTPYDASCLTRHASCTMWHVPLMHHASHIVRHTSRTSMLVRTPHSCRNVGGNQTHLDKIHAPMGRFNRPDSYHHVHNTYILNIQTHTMDLAGGTCSSVHVLVSSACLAPSDNVQYEELPCWDPLRPNGCGSPGDVKTWLE